jgi:mediator of RNA polymerase II transcription subunit 10
VVNDSTKDKDKPGGGTKPVGQRVNDVVSHLAALDDLARNVRTMIPMQVLSDVDNSRNPMQITKDRIERAATENQFMNGKIAAIRTYSQLLDEGLCQSFPALIPYLRPPVPPEQGLGPSTGTEGPAPTVNGDNP